LTLKAATKITGPTAVPSKASNEQFGGKAPTPDVAVISNATKTGQLPTASTFTGPSGSTGRHAGDKTTVK
jgi:hypothetical protein